MLNDQENGLSIKNLKMTVDQASPRLWSRRERQVWMFALFFGCVMMYACRTVMPLCMPSLAKQYGWNKSQAGTILSAFFWGYTLTQILGGYFSDRTGGLFVISATAVGWSMTTFWTPVLPEASSSVSLNFYLLVLSRVIIGAAQGVFFPALSSLLCHRVLESERASTFSGITSGTHAGTLLCGALGSVLLGRFGWSSPFFAIGTLAMGWLVLIRFFLIAKEKRKSMILSVKELTSTVSNLDTSRTVPWLQLFKAVPFWAIIIGHYCMNNAFFVLLSWLPSYFHENFPDSPSWLYNVVPWMVSIPATFMSGIAVDKLIVAGVSVTVARKLAATVALGGAGFSLILLGYTSSFEAALVCMTVTIACCGFHAGGILVNPQDIAPAYAGSVFGIMNTAGAVPGFIGVYIAGHILDVTQSWAMVFNATALVSLFGCLIYVLFGTGRKIID